MGLKRKNRWLGIGYIGLILMFLSPTYVAPINVLWHQIPLALLIMMAAQIGFFLLSIIGYRTTFRYWAVSEDRKYNQPRR